MSYDGPRFSMPRLGPAIKLLLLINCVVFVANMLLLGRLSEPSAGGGGLWFAFSGTGLLDGYGLGVLRLVTYQFTHSFQDPMHVLMNMLVLVFFGPQVEGRLGSAGAIRLYLWGGVVGAIGHVLIAAMQGHAGMPVVGASGACYSFLLYAAFMAPHSTVILILFPVPLWALATLLVGIGAYSTFIEFTTGFSGGVSHGAHLGGALLGALAYRRRWFIDYRSFDSVSPMGLLAALKGRLRARRAQRRAASAARDEQQLEELLAKIKAQGLASLTASERRFLDQVSQRSRDSR